VSIVRECKRHHRKAWRVKHLENGVYMVVCMECGREIPDDEVKAARADR
jgi:RNA polymerase-binding transcription factor DksA